MAFWSWGHPSSRGGRVRVIGCGPGCLVTTLLLSLALTILINVAIRLF
jgi:hypothetical protein